MGVAECAAVCEAVLVLLLAVLVAAPPGRALTFLF